MSDGLDTAGIFSCMSYKPVHICQAVLVVLVVGSRLAWIKCMSSSIRSKNSFF